MFFCAACSAHKYAMRVRKCDYCWSTLPPRADLIEIDTLGKTALARASGVLREMALQGKTQLVGKRFSRKLCHRDLLEQAIVYRRIKKRTGWFSQVWFDGGRFVGDLTEDVCHMGRVEAIVKHMVTRKMTQFRVSNDLHAWFKRYCIRKGVSMSDVLINHLEKLRQQDERDSKVEQI